MSATELAFKPFTRQQMAQHAAADIPRAGMSTWASASRP